MKKTMKVLGGSLLVALMSISLATKLNVRGAKTLEVRDVLTEEFAKPVTGKVVRKAANEEAANKISAVKAQVSAENEGKRHIRFVVGLDSANYANAKFDIVAKDGENVVKRFADQPVTTAYTHIVANDVTLSAEQAFGVGYNYLIAFTIKNVPSSAWGYNFEVTSSVKTAEATEWASTAVAKKVINEIASVDEVAKENLIKDYGIAFGSEVDAFGSNFGKAISYWNDQGWRGSHTTVTASKENDEYTLTSTLNYGSNWFALQIFVAIPGMVHGNPYTSSLVLNSTVAGQITVNGQVRDIVVGDNNIVVTKEYNGVVGEGGSILSIQFGVYGGDAVANNAMLNATYVLKNFVVTGNAEEVEIPEEPELPTVTDGFVLYDTKFGEEIKVGMDGYVGTTIAFWNDQNWVGSYVNVEASVENEVATYVVSTAAANCWHGFQLFASPVGNYETVSLTLNSSVAGKIKFNGTEIDIVVGDNNLKADVTAGAGLSIQFGSSGNFENNQVIQNATYVVSNLVFGMKTVEIVPAEPQYVDFDTIVTTNANGDSSYTKTFITASGWIVNYSAIQTGGSTVMNPQFPVIGPDNTHKAICLNGKTSAYGSLTSPTLSGTLTKIVIDYTKMFTDTELSMTLTVTDLSTGDKQTHVISNLGLDKNEKYVVYNDEWVLDTPIVGDFTIEVVNNCPSNLNSNKDRITILDLMWQ